MALVGGTGTAWRGTARRRITMHMPRPYRANAVHTRRTHAVPTPYPRRAGARTEPPMPYPRDAHAVPMPCSRRAPCDAAQVRMAAQRTGWAASAASSAVSGEGLICFFQGPGRLWLQTHKPRLESGAKGSGRRKPANGEAVVACLICMLFFFGILTLGFMFVAAPAAFIDGPRDSWAEATGPHGHPPYRGLRHGEL